ncbi:unnamed protein product [Alternaria alternata]
MTAEDELIASQMLDDDERAELDETGLVAQTSESVPQSNAKSVAEPKNEGAVEPKYANSLLDAYNEVWPDAGKAKPISPTKHVVPGGLRRISSPSSRLTRSRARLSLVPATKPPYAQSSVTWTPKKAVNKFGKHLVKVNKGLPSNFRPKFSAGNIVRDSNNAGEVSKEHSSQVSDKDDEQDTLISAPSTPAPPPRLPPRRSSLKSFQPKTLSPRKKVAIQEPVVSPPTAPRSNGPSSRTRSRSATVEPSAVPSTPSKKATPRKKAVARKTTPRKKASVPSKSPVSRKKAAPPAVVASSASRANGPSSTVVKDSAGSNAVAPEGSVVKNPVVPGNKVANVEPAAEAARSSSLLRSLSDYFGFLSG